MDEDIENIGKDFLKPSLYPILLLLARLYPSSVEGVDSNLQVIFFSIILLCSSVFVLFNDHLNLTKWFELFQLVRYIPYLLTCAKSCVLKTRRLAAKAMVPLITHDKSVYFLTFFIFICYKLTKHKYLFINVACDNSDNN